MEKSKDKYKIVLIVIFILAILIRIIFICRTNISDYQYDFGAGNLNSENSYDELYKNYDKDNHEGRHINYIMHIYNYNSLPNKIIGQFYHPPLHHFIMANWLKLMDNFSNFSSFKLESMQFISLGYSIIILIALYKILDEMEFDNRDKILPMILFSFYPLYIFLSGSINNDELVIMFCTLVYLYLLKWEKNQNIINTILVATFLGLGLMTKTSAFVMVVPSVYVYFKVFMKNVNENKPIKKLLVELIIFSLISGILGLWFQVSSLIKGLNTIGIIQPYEELRVTTNNVWYRFGLTNIIKPSIVNVWNYLIYSSIDFSVTIKNSIYCKIMAILIVIIGIDTLYYLIKDLEENKLINITILTWWISYFYLNITMPYTCSMHSRYMVIPLSLGIIIFSKGISKEKNKFMKNQAIVLSVVISILSTVYFLFI